MPKVKHLDVLIVYNGKIAMSACLPSLIPTPFPPGIHESCNTAYSYFLTICHKLGITAGFASSYDIIGPGICANYWTFGRKAWHKHRTPCYSTLIFDKFSPKTTQNKARRQLLFSSPTIISYNNPTLFNLFFDKQKTYDALSLHSIPTVSLGKNTLMGIQKSCQSLAKLLYTHPGSHDFSRDIIMKDRFGAGGNHIYKFKSGQSANMLKITRQNTDVSFVIQPFAKFDQGFSYLDLPASADIRLIYLGGKIIESYIRTAAHHDFRCNQHQGGTLTYLSLTEIPEELMTKSNSIVKLLHNQQSLYSLDFIMSNSGNPYLLEGNSGPGLDWDLSVKQEEVNAKKFIRAIVQNIALRATPAWFICHNTYII